MERRLRILVVGASGTLGSAIVAELAPRHDIVAGGSKSGDIRIAAFFRGFDPVPAARAARAFSRSVEGLETGKTYRVD